MYAVKAADAPGVSDRTRYNRQERWNADGLVPGYAGGYPSRFTAELKPELFEKVREKRSPDDRRSPAPVALQRRLQSGSCQGIPTSFDMRFGNPCPWDHLKTR